MSDRTLGAFGHDYTDLACVLRDRDTRYVYVPNPGNAGDSYIAANTYRFFRATGLRFDIGHVSRAYPGRDVIYPGGGNLIPGYTPARDFFQRNKDIVRSLTLLPHTVRGHEDLLGRLDGRVTLFAREEPTITHLKSAAPGARTFFCHDMAFFADPRNLTELQPLTLVREGLRDWRHPGMLRYHLDARERWRRLVAERDAKWGTGAAPGTGVLNAFRTDDESTDIALPPDNIDLSERFAHPGHMRPPMVNAIVRAMIGAMEPFPLVRTNRLHVAIMAALLDKSVEIADNSYGKLGAVYAASMQGRFPKVRFIEQGRDATTG